MRWAALAVLLIACSGGGESPVIASPTDYPDAFHEAECRYLARCGVFASFERCAASNLVFVPNIDRSAQAAVDAGKATWDPARAGECLHEIAAQSCDVTSESAQLHPELCYGALAGTVAGGEACENDADCISQLCTAQCTDQCCEGTCIEGPAPGPVGIGQVCGGNACASGGYCASTIDGPSVCMPLIAAGDPCESEGCAYGTACIGGVCKAPPGTGEPCSGPEQLCRDLGTACIDGACAAFGAEGAPCGIALAGCLPLFKCDQTGRCSNGAPTNGTCDGEFDAECAHYGDVCGASRHCAPPEPVGASCQSSPDCESRRCANGHCAAALECP